MVSIQVWTPWRWNDVEVADPNSDAVQAFETIEDAIEFADRHELGGYYDWRVVDSEGGVVYNPPKEDGNE